MEEPLTHRRDAWWVAPLFTFVAYTAFIVYATFRVFEPIYFDGAGFFADPFDAYRADNGVYHYLSPFGSPDLRMLVPGFLHAIPVLGVMLTTPAFLILPMPAGFRFTCYYYRKSYYRAFVARPAACAVPAAVPGGSYKGERGLMVIQNLHRYFLYLAIIIVFVLLYDAIRSIITPNGLYFGLGSAILLINVVFLAFYTFGCHSFRHLVGGKLDCFSCDSPSTTRYGLWSKVTVLNGRHALWAWVSLGTVVLADLYIRYVVIANPGMTHFLGVPI